MDFGETHSFESKCQLVPFNFGQTFPSMSLVYSLMQRNACNPPQPFKDMDRCDFHSQSSVHFLSFFLKP